MNTFNRDLLRCSVRTMYDMQQLRIQNGNRICAAFRVKLGLESSEAEEEDTDANKLLKQLRSEYKRITDGVKRVTKNTKFESQIITTRGELALIESYEKSLEAEDLHEKLILEQLETTKIWNDYLLGVKGVGPRMAGVILSEVDITKCQSVSAMWKYTGVDVVMVEKDGELVGEGRSAKAHHLVDKEMTRADGEKTQFKGLSYNPLAKSKLLGVLGPSFIKQGGYYKEVYNGYKFRLENHVIHSKKTKMHRHKMANRYMIKIFLMNLWLKWRELEGLTVTPPYHEAKLGLHHSGLTYDEAA